MSTEAEKVLIKQIRQGDAQAWERLINLYEGRLLAFAVRRVRDRSAAEDVVQETFVGFLNSLPNFDETRELQTYLFTIASYKLTDHLRRSGRHPLQHVSDGPDDLLHHKPDEHAGASSIARSHERKEIESEAVARCLGQLVDRWREQGEYVRIKVLELLFVKGWPNHQVAEFLGVSEQQVANIRFAAVKKIGENVRN